MNEPFSNNGHEEAAPTPISSFPDPMGVLHRRKSHLVVGAAIGVVLGVLFYVMSPKRYESNAQILVLKKQTTNPLVEAGREYNAASPMIQQDFLETHRTVLKSPLVVSWAIEQDGLDKLPSFQGAESISEAIIKNLKVERDIDKKSPTTFTSQVLNVTFRGNAPEDCAVVVDAIRKSYQHFLSDSSHSAVKETLELIKNARKVVKDDLDEKEKKYSEFRASTPVLWKGPDGATLYQIRLGYIDMQRSAYLKLGSEIKATLESAEEAMKSEGGALAALEILSGFSPMTATVSNRSKHAPAEKEATLPKDMADLQASSSQTHSTLEEQFVSMQLRENELLERFGPKHPHVQEVRDSLESLRFLLYPGSARKNGKLTEKHAKLVQSLVDARMSQLNQELKETKRSKAALDKLFNQELEEAKKVFPYETQDDAFKRSIDRSNFIFENLMKRMEDLDLISNVGGFDSQVITPPKPGEKVWPIGLVVFPLSLLLGLLGGFCVGYLAEMADKSFRTPEEVRRQLGLPIVGHIPMVKVDNSTLKKIEAEGGTILPTICAYYRPKSRDAESYRGVRTALYFNTRGGGYKVIQVTSPDMGDGKSTLTANLAVSLAQTGKRVLIIDADLRRPQQGDIFGLTHKQGFAAVLGGNLEPMEAVLATAVPNLSLMPAGSPPANPAELLTSPRLKEVLDYLSERFDTILVDTPPLLAVTDPSVVAPRVDGVLLTFRLSKESRPHAMRAKEILDVIGAKILGVVVNAIDPNDKTTGYGYGYGSKYGGYGYGYGYGYYQGNNRYYEEEDGDRKKETAAPEAATRDGK